MTNGILYGPMTGAEMKQIRKKMRLNQSQMGMVMCVVSSTVSLWETGRMNIAPERAVLARLLAANPASFAQALDETGALIDPAQEIQA